jgi:membrane dipeptidase
MITVDLHVCSPWIMTNWGKFNLTQGSPKSKMSIPLAKQGGLDVPVFVLYLSNSLQVNLSRHAIRHRLQEQYKWLKSHSSLQQCNTREDVEEALRLGKMPYFLALENASFIHDRTMSMQFMKDVFNIKYLTLAHNTTNTLVDSATDYSDHTDGLSYLGLETIQEAERHKITIDISHASHNAATSILNVSTRPVIASHSACRELNDSVRNVKKSVVSKIAATKGLIGIPFSYRIVDSTPDHIDAIVQHVGPKYVAIGSDIDATNVLRDTNVSNWKELVIEPLVKRGYSWKDIEAIAGGNALRILCQQE